MRYPTFLLTALFAFPALAADPPVTFNRDIRPILSENCFHCHGPDDAHQEAGLRLDIAGEVDFDEVIARVTSEDPDTIMPPPDADRILKPAEIDLIKDWVQQGAQYQGHWSFISPTAPKIPASDDPTLSPIDRFIQRKLDEQAIAPAPPASKETLIRRATFDLIGLPPTIAEIDEFLNDDSPLAYEHLLDRLLDRPEYGERMASEWLDAARYSDTYGFQVDRDRYVWPWRDWVIGALNDNLPYDQFITQQLAGDLLPPAATTDETRKQVLATTFNRLHPQESEGGSVPEEYRIEYVTDRAQTVATAIMGLTYECCRCHNHKYDPISQEEYFQLTAFFDNIDEAGLYSYFTDAIPTPTLTLPTPSQEASLEKKRTDLVAVEKSAREVREKHRAFWQQQIGDGHFTDFQSIPPIYSLDFEHSPPGRNSLVEGIDGNAFQLTGDDAVNTTVGNFDRSEPFSVSLWIKTPDVKERAVVFHRSRAWTDAASRGYELLIEDGKLAWSLIHFWPGNQISIKTTGAVPVGQWVHVAVTNDGSSRAHGLRIYVNGKQAETETIQDSLIKNITGGGGDTIAIGERFRDRGFKNGSVDKLRVFDVAITEFEARNEAALQSSPNDVPPEILIDHALARHDVSIESLSKKLLDARTAKCRVEDSLQEIMVMRESAGRRDTHVLGRGDYSQPEQVVSPGTPASMLPFPTNAPRNRLGLAKWLTDPKHPLTARVAVNRLWQILFGTGLVRTPEDFGSQGTPPSHPELLDELATRYIAIGWDTKAMLKRIMLSRTYRQSSRNPDESSMRKDPENVFLSRFPSYRLPAEMMRDASLAISGKLVKTIGGPPAKPYEVEASFKPVDRDKGDGLYRRSLYTYWKRTAPAPVMMTLDAPSRDVCRVSRERTASPLQAFVMLNGPQYVEAARGFAETLAQKHAGDTLGTDGVAEAFLAITSRRANQNEQQVLEELYAKQKSYFDADPSRATELLEVGDSAFDANLPGSPVAAMTVVIGTLLNYDGSMVKR
ncbi:DUF1553 domain-containing protein [Rubripirellula reticaptiva]|uniref:Planctomycete cytochrome C n=1 Tax=Rubripirellula reticaptiva TaxID=2528013 RepID=A0A5C6EJX8_9BACT|nr:DUF1553 domain-containing protein [Rubripirellula reticaptiva]TWU48417.1 Planctomycete cytochrome C [Rubripirellula reticaptiva]